MMIHQKKVTVKCRHMTCPKRVKVRMLIHMVFHVVCYLKLLFYHTATASKQNEVLVSTCTFVNAQALIRPIEKGKTY